MNKLLFEKLEAIVTFYATVIMASIFRTQGEIVLVLVTSIAAILAGINYYLVNQRIKYQSYFEENEKID